RLPHLPLLQLAVGEQAVDAAAAAVQARAEGEADGLREALAERAAGDVEAGRALERALLDARPVRAVGAQLVEGVLAELVERREEHDRGVARREDEAVELGAKLVEVEAGEEVREREALAGVALAAAAAH